MAHFYGEVFGQSQSTATRTGSKSSGVRAYAQSWNACLTVSVDHDGHEDKTYGRFNIGPGPSAYNAGSLSLLIRDPEQLVRVLGMDTDERFRNKVQKFKRAFQEIEDDLQRAEKSALRRKAERERRERREEAERQALVDGATKQERRNYALLCVIDTCLNHGETLTMGQASDKIREWDLTGAYDGETFDRMNRDFDRRGQHLYRNEDGDLCIGEAYHCNNLTKGERIER